MILTDEQQMLREAAIGWVRERAPVGAVRCVREDHAAIGHDPALYREMVEMGWSGIAIPEAEGGFDFGLVGAGVVAEELGRNLVCSPFIGSCIVAADALAVAGSDEQKQQWLAPILSGETVAALALDEGPHHNPEAVQLEARRDGDGWVLSGTKRPVFDGPAASLFIVVARTGAESGHAAGLSLFLCPAAADGVTVTTMCQLDSRGAAEVVFEAVRLPGTALLGTQDDGHAVLSRILDRGRAVLAAEMLGSAQQAFETTIEYLRTRVQFDRPIGSFQALQHRAVSLLSQIELTRSAIRAALFAMDRGDADAPRLVSLAKALAGKTFRKVAQEMIQMHGGIGMTDEHDAGLYLKRAHVADMTYGNAAYHRSRHARLSGL